MKNRQLGAIIVVIGLLAVVYGAGSALGLSGVSTTSCISVYGIDPAVLQSNGTPVSPTQLFNYQTSQPGWTGFQWNSPVTQSNGDITWTSTNGLAIFSWDPNIVLYQGVYYDLTLYESGGCTEGYSTTITGTGCFNNGSGPCTTSTIIQTISTTLPTTQTMVSSSASAQSSSSSSSSVASSGATCASSVKGACASHIKASVDLPIVLGGVVVLGVGLAVTKKKGNVLG